MRWRWIRRARIAPKDITQDTFRTADGLIMPKDDAILTPRILRRLKRGMYEAKELAALKRLLKREDRVLELGGGIGVISGFAGAVAKAAAITVVEANPHLAAYIREVHALNDIASTVHHGAVTPEPGPPIDFHLREDFLAASLDAEAAPVAETVFVPALPICDLIAEARPSVLIADIEGAEVGVLAAADLSAIRLAIVETHPQWIGAEGIRSVFEVCHGAGLTYFHRGSQGKVLCFGRDW